MLTGCSGAGPPQLMMAFTEDKQVDDELLAKRDSEQGKSTAECKAVRQHLHDPVKIHPNANHWQVGGRCLGRSYL